MAPSETKWWPSAKPGETLSDESLLKKLEEHVDEMEKSYQDNPNRTKQEYMALLNELQRVQIHQATQGKKEGAITVDRLKALPKPSDQPSQLASPTKN